MKKKALAMVLATTMVASMAVGCGSKTDAPAADKGSTETAAAGDDSAAGSGKVYLLNFKPESDEAWQDLAKTYTDQTGTEVTVLTAADGQYNATLQSEMAKSDAPTIFNVGNADAAKTWNDYTVDLKGFRTLQASY